jgi:aconitate decarboxylase
MTVRVSRDQGEDAMGWGTTSRLAAFVAGLAYESIPEPVADKVKRQCLDLLGVAVIGSTQAAGPTASRALDRVGRSGDAVIWGTSSRASVSHAALVNGINAHVADYDDTWLPLTHPSAPTVTAAVAVAELLGSSGAELLTAVLAGYEVMGRLRGAVSGRAGWHPTGVFGTFAAAAAGARLLGLSPAQTSGAFGIAASSASGIDGHEGTMTKAFHAGHAAQAGLEAAFLAAEGFTASDRVFDSGDGFFEAFFRDFPYDEWRVTSALGDSFYVMNPGVGIKLYPVGYWMQQTFEAVLEIVLGHDLKPSDIESVEIRTRPGTRFERPEVRTGLEGKFSLHYMAALAILHRHMTLDSFSDDVAQAAPMRELLTSIRTRVDQTLPKNPDLAHNPVTVRCRNGTEYHNTVVRSRSHWNYPLEKEQWLGKFRTTAGAVFDEERVHEIEELVLDLEHLDDVRELTNLLISA